MSQALPRLLLIVFNSALLCLMVPLFARGWNGAYTNKVMAPTNTPRNFCEGCFLGEPFPARGSLQCACWVLAFRLRPFGVELAHQRAVTKLLAEAPPISLSLLLASYPQFTCGLALVAPFCSSIVGRDHKCFSGISKPHTMLHQPRHAHTHTQQDEVRTAG